MKKSGLIILTFLLSINFISAQGISELLEAIDQQTLILYAVFIISFCLLYFSLAKTLFRDQTNKVFAAVISAVISLLLVYWVNKTDFDVSGFFFDLGVPEDLFLTIIPIAILAGVIFVIFKFAKDSLFIVGGLCILLGFFVEEKVALFTLGGILILTRLFIIPKNAWMPKRGKSFIGQGMGI